jgi:hypothetical protein
MWLYAPPGQNLAGRPVIERPPGRDGISRVILAVTVWQRTRFRLRRRRTEPEIMRNMLAAHGRSRAFLVISRGYRRLDGM